jgi:hypothetical protein
LKVHIEALGTKIEELEAKIPASAGAAVGVEPTPLSGIGIVGVEPALSSVTTEASRTRKGSLPNGDVLSKLGQLRRYKTKAKRRIEQLEAELAQYKTPADSVGEVKKPDSSALQVHTKRFSISCEQPDAAYRAYRTYNHSPKLKPQPSHKKMKNRRIASYDLRNSRTNFNDVFRSVTGDRATAYSRPHDRPGVVTNPLMVSVGKGVIGGDTKRRRVRERAKTQMKHNGP